MHHGQNGGSQKIKLKNVNSAEIGGTFVNFLEIGGNIQYASLVEGVDALNVINLCCFTSGCL